MITISRIFSISIVTLILTLTYSLSSIAQTLYSCDVPFENTRILRTVDLETGETLSEREIILPGQEIRGCNGLAKDPTTGACWIILTPPSGGGGDGPGARILALLNPKTARAQEVGNTGLAIAGIAFGNDGTLYALTGDQDGDAIPTIYTLNKNTGEPSLFLEMVNTDDGEALGFNPIDGHLYRMNGRGNQQVFESINPTSKEVAEIPLSGDQISETTALTHLNGNTLLATDTGADFYSLSTDGTATFISHLDDDYVSKGIAFDCGIPEERAIPTLSEWGLMAMAGVLGLLGLLAIRRRKAAA